MTLSVGAVGVSVRGVGASEGGPVGGSVGLIVGVTGVAIGGSGKVGDTTSDVGVGVVLGTTKLSAVSCANRPQYKLSSGERLSSLSAPSTKMIALENAVVVSSTSTICRLTCIAFVSMR